MAIRKFIEEIGEKILPSRGNAFPVGKRQHMEGGDRSDYEQHFEEPRHYISGVDVTESANAIRRYLQTRRSFQAPSDLVVFFDEVDAVAIIGGTVRDERTRDLMVQAVGNVHGVERVDDRTTLVREASA